MLSSLENDLAIVDWRSAEQTLASLATLVVDVCRAPFALDPVPPAVAPGVRRVYVIDLRNAIKPDEVVEALMTLLKQRQVVTVSLAGLKPAIPKSNPSPEPVKLQPTKAMNTSPSIPAQSLEKPIPRNRTALITPLTTPHSTRSSTASMTSIYKFRPSFPQAFLPPQKSCTRDRLQR